MRRMVKEFLSFRDMVTKLNSAYYSFVNISDCLFARENIDCRRIVAVYAFASLSADSLVTPDD